jgi:alanine dehydrogenase
MDLLLLNADEVRELLPMADCVPVMREALRTLSAGTSVQPLRSRTVPPGRTEFMLAMPGFLAEPSGLGIKVLTVFPQNAGRGRPVHQGLVVLFDDADGSPRALVDAGAITGIRTGAVSAVATDALARPDAASLAILGSGVQAEAHAEAMRAVRPIERIRVWDRDPKKARALADRLSDRYRSSIECEAAESAERAIRRSDILCTTTASTAPIVEGAWLPDGIHVNAVGAASPGLRELDPRALRRCRMYADRRESVESESDEFRIARSEGIIGSEHLLGEIGEVLLGRIAGRLQPSDCTLFKSLGLAIEDLAAARALCERALQLGKGTRVPFGGDPPGAPVQ